MVKKLDLLVTLSPSMPHFRQFATDNRLAGVRINSAMMYANELDGELEAAKAVKNPVPLYFDIKGRQLRVKEVIPKETHLELRLNHRISVRTPTPVLFKSGEDGAVLEEIRGDDVSEQILVFCNGPKYMVRAGESVCIRNKTFRVMGDQFPDYEKERIQKVVKSGVFNRWVLSYVESQRDIDQFREYVGRDAEVIAKIENARGLTWVENYYKRQDNLSLMAARGDLYIEVDKPHEILGAMKLVIKKDPNAIVGSRLLLSCGPRSVPDAADFSELAWLYDIGYRRMMLCDDLCLKEETLGRAVKVFGSFKEYYVPFTLCAPPVPADFLKPTIQKKKKRLSWLVDIFAGN
jgi:pyruvate kinase